MLARNRITMAEWHAWLEKGTTRATKVKSVARTKVTPIGFRVTEVGSAARLIIHIDGLRLIAELNRREHHMQTHRRKNAQQEIVHRAFLSKGVPKKWILPLLVTVTRVALGRLDPTENLPSSAKHVIDQLAKEFGVNDRRDDLVKYVVAQRAAKRGVYGVEIMVEAKGEA